MNFDELTKLKSFLEELKEKNCRFKFEEDAVDSIVLQVNNLVSMVTRVNKIEEIVKVKVRKNIDDYFQRLGIKILDDDKYDTYFESIFRIDYYKNYYVGWFQGVPYLNFSFVFDVDGNLLFAGDFVEQLDKENFIGIKYFDDDMIYKAVHYQYMDSKFNLVKCLDNVDNIEYNQIFKGCSFNKNLIIFSCEDNYMLYDYKNREVLIPSFSEITSDLGNFVGADKTKYMRVIKKIYGVIDYKSNLVSRLEYLVDKDGKVDVFGVYDFGDKRIYSLVDRGNSQVEQLNSIYDEVAKNRIDYIKYNVNSRVKTLKDN